MKTSIIQKIKEQKKDSKKRVLFYMSSSLHKHFKETCDKNGLSMSEVTEQLLKEFLRNI